MKAPILILAEVLLLVIFTGCNPSPEFTTFDDRNAPGGKDKDKLIDSTPTPTSTNESTPLPTPIGGGVTPTPSPTVTGTVSPTPTVAVTITPDPTVTGTATPTPTISVTVTPTPTVTPNLNLKNYPFSVTTTSLKPIIDVVFIVDNSGSMSDEQTYLSNGVKNMVSNLKGNNINFHIYTTSNDGNKTITNTTTTYSPNNIAPYSAVQSHILRPQETISPSSIQLRDTMSDSEVNTMGTQFKNAITALGINGSGREQGACSLLRTLYDEGQNRVLNNSSYAAFVVISDEQDSSDLSTCFYQKTWDVNVSNQIVNSQNVTFPGSSQSNNLQLSFVEKAESMFGQNRFTYSAIIHDQNEDAQFPGCPLPPNSLYGTKYRDIANMVTLSNVFSICASDYSPALAPISQFVQTTSTNTYAIPLQTGESIYGVQLIRAGVTTTLVNNVDYQIQNNNIEFTGLALNSTDNINVIISY